VRKSFRIRASLRKSLHATYLPYDTTLNNATIGTPTRGKQSTGPSTHDQSTKYHADNTTKSQNTSTTGYPPLAAFTNLTNTRPTYALDARIQKKQTNT
jgi:hypothetical protein